MWIMILMMFEHMIGYMLLYAAYMLLYVTWLHSCMYDFIHVFLFACIIHVGLVSSIICSCLIVYVCACVWFVMHYLCIFMFSCGKVYNDVMVVIMHEVVVCVVDKVMH